MGQCGAKSLSTVKANMQGALRAPFDVLYSATPENPIPKLKHNGSAVIVPISRAVIGARYAPVHPTAFHNSACCAIIYFFGNP
jgi:hypothetical protein